MRLVDQVALVTGSSQGIGREIAFRLASEGCHVALASRQLEQLKQVAERVQNTGSQALALKMDVTKRQDVGRAFQRIKKRFGRLDLLVNNAGVGLHGPLEEMTPRQIQQVFEINVFGPIECCRRAIPLMKGQGEGCIINIASIAGTVGVANMAVYAASKWALRGLGLSLSQELRKTNIRVHNVCPGSVETGFFDTLPEDNPIRKENPQLRLNADDIAQAVVYLATLSDRCKVEELIIGARKLWASR